jgi:hypothetical protein
MVLLVEARGMAPKRFRDVLVGPDRTALAVADGDTDGRQGNPGGDAELDKVDMNWWKFASEAALKTLAMNHVVEVRVERNTDDFAIRLNPQGK